jgi:hypothetical protein
MVRPELIEALIGSNQKVQTEEKLPLEQITDWDLLVELKEDIFHRYSPHQQVDERMREVLPNILPHISSWYRLEMMWGDCYSGSEERKQIEVRMEEVVKCMSDWYELNHLWDDTYTCALEGMVSERIAQLISEVSAEECPDWFLALLRDPDSCVVSDVLEQKIKDLKAELNIPN